MSNQSGSRAVGQSGRWRWAVLAALLPVCPSARLLAQVGHDPSRSPFRDITTRQQVSFIAGRFGGNTTKAGSGARPGTAYGFRLHTRLSGPLDLAIGGSYIATSRVLINPLQPDSLRRSGPVDLGLFSGDVSLTLTLTGNKTWHGFAPWVGFGFGVVAPTRSTTDTGGFRVGTNFSIVPSFGTSVRLGESLHLEVEARDNTMRYEWPLAYFFPKDASGNALPFKPVLPTGQRDRQLTHNFTLSVGLSYRFNF